MDGERPFEPLPILVILEDRRAPVAATCSRRSRSLLAKAFGARSRRRSEFKTLVALELHSASG
jgi:hypothetical protein